ncbi:hypothetical protein HK096_006987 [Nowakowskiella sp. JEL0078]|nr:hypothetical protein HK096_006987 [Nowakowskiella sp. JEL0078]
MSETLYYDKIVDTVLNDNNGLLKLAESAMKILSHDKLQNMYLLNRIKKLDEFVKVSLLKIKQRAEEDLSFVSLINAHLDDIRCEVSKTNQKSSRKMDANSACRSKPNNTEDEHLESMAYPSNVRNSELFNSNCKVTDETEKLFEEEKKIKQTLSTKTLTSCEPKENRKPTISLRVSNSNVKETAALEPLVSGPVRFNEPVTNQGTSITQKLLPSTNAVLEFSNSLDDQMITEILTSDNNVGSNESKPFELDLGKGANNDSEPSLCITPGHKIKRKFIDLECDPTYGKTQRIVERIDVSTSPKVNFLDQEIMVGSDDESLQTNIPTHGLLVKKECAKISMENVHQKSRTRSSICNGAEIIGRSNPPPPADFEEFSQTPNRQRTQYLQSTKQTRSNAITTDLIPTDPQFLSSQTDTFISFSSRSDSDEDFNPRQQRKPNKQPKSKKIKLKPTQSSSSQRKSNSSREQEYRLPSKKSQISTTENISSGTDLSTSTLSEIDTLIGSDIISESQAPQQGTPMLTLTELSLTSCSNAEGTEILNDQPNENLVTPEPVQIIKKDLEWPEEMPKNSDEFWDMMLYGSQKEVCK